jgi:hypothetical protein
MAKADWLCQNPEWLSKMKGWNGLAMRTNSTLWPVKIQSSTCDAQQNVANGNFLMFEISKKVTE